MDTFVYTPLYNLLVLIIDTFPGMDFGVSIILLTILVKILLLPFAIRAIRAQQAVKAIEPKVKELQEKYKDDKQLLGVELMALYKKNKVNPFSSIGLILVQIPIIFGLYYIVLRAGLPEIDPTRLYAFIPVPDINPSAYLFGVLDVASRSLPLAMAAGVAQFIQTRIALPPMPKSDGSNPQAEMMQMITKQMQYIFPVIITVIAYMLSAAVALYFLTSNVFHIAQELYVRSKGIKDQSSVAFDI